MELPWLALVCADDAAALIKAWLGAQRNERRLSPHSIRAYTSDMQDFLTFANRHFGGLVQVEHLSSCKITDFRSWLAARATAGITNASRARQVATIRNFYRWCDRNGYFHNPAIQVLTTPKIPHRQPHPLIEKDVLTVLDETKTETDTWLSLRDFALFTLLYACGLRISEALGLKENQLNSDVLQITGKGGRDRQVPFLPAARTAIDAYMRIRPFPTATDGLVFRGEKGGALNQGMAQKRLRNIRNLLGLPDNVTPHALRHSYATHLLGNGLNIREVQHLLGHASLSSTQIYTEVDYKKMLEIVRAAHPRA